MNRGTGVESTEVYTVRGDEKLRDGALDYADNIESRDAAEVDALRRCSADPGIRKVAYYRVREDGGFRVLYSHTNPNALPRKPAQTIASTPRRRRKPSRPAKPAGLLDRLLNVLKE